MTYFVIREDGYIVITDSWRDAEKALKNYYHYGEIAKEKFLSQYGNVEIMPTIVPKNIIRDEDKGIYTEKEFIELIRKRFREIEELIINEFIKRSKTIEKKKIERQRRPEIKIRQVRDYRLIHKTLERKCKEPLYDEEYYDENNTYTHIAIFKFKDRIGILSRKGYYLGIYISIPLHRFKKVEETLKYFIEKIEVYSEEKKNLIRESLSKALSIINNTKNTEIPDDVKENITTLLLAIA